MKEVCFQLKTKLLTKRGSHQQPVNHIGIHHHYVEQVVKDILIPLIAQPSDGVGQCQLDR